MSEEYGLNWSDYILIENLKAQIRELMAQIEVMRVEVGLMKLRWEVDRLKEELLGMELPSEVLDQYIQLITAEDEDDFIEQDQESEDDHD